MGYPFTKIEKKWQAKWLEQHTFSTPENVDTKKPKFYVLDMFPYPSGAGLHVGHPEGYTATDIVARYKRLKGFNVMHPMGWDAFGLPAEQYAIETGTHPRVTTAKNINHFRHQLQAIGFSYDWDREVDTTDPNYFKWTQWIFIQLYKKGLAYLADVPVNWCPALGTVLANEEVIDGKSERGGHPVYRRPMRQWMLKITAYADRLLEDLEGLDWPESTKEMQRNWIGKSEGAEVRFKLDGHDDEIVVFTTRPDTLFGATYMALAPEHPLVDKITVASQKTLVKEYQAEASRKSDLERTEMSKEKSGVFTGAYAINPVNHKKIPVWIADYVLISYGFGAIMAVPAEDERDYEFAEKFDLPIVRTVQPPAGFKGKAFTGDGPAINSKYLNGLRVQDAKPKMIEYLEEKGIGKRKINYKLRDWLFSRQRYWGEPFPILHDPESGKSFAVDTEELPVTLPEMEDFKPQALKSEDELPKPPLSRAPDSWKFVERDGKIYVREFNTMPQWAGSCWYYLRYIDPNNKHKLISDEKEKYWLPVDLYVGGAEHSVLHLLYARFWHKVLFDIGVVSTKEPFQKLVHQGMILGEAEYTSYIDKDGKYYSNTELADINADERERIGLHAVAVPEDKVESTDGHVFLKNNPDIQLDVRSFKMSKSRGNVINPDDIIKRYGADSLRLYEMFMGPLEAMKPWSMTGVDGVHRFLNRLWRLVMDDDSGNVHSRISDGGADAVQLKVLHKAIKKVTEDIEAMRFNTAISAMMIFVNEAYKWKNLPREIIDIFLTIVNPFAPHITEELWLKVGHDDEISSQVWPTHNEAFLKEKLVECVIQINGKIRDKMKVDVNLDKNSFEALALKHGRIPELIKEKSIKKIIVIPGRLVNIVV